GEIAKSGAPLRGIVHAAGVLDDGVMLQQTWERFAKVMAPKVDGAWRLHEATRDLPLDFFVCFSSIGSLTGAPRQAHYAAANAWLDAFAHFRRQQGVKALTVNWGAWASSGMAAALSERDRKRQAEMGLSTIAADQGLAVMQRLLAADVAEAAVLPIEWRRFLA